MKLVLIVTTVLAAANYALFRFHRFLPDVARVELEASDDGYVYVSVRAPEDPSSSDLAGGFRYSRTRELVYAGGPFLDTRILLASRRLERARVTAERTNERARRRAVQREEP